MKLAIILYLIPLFSWASPAFTSKNCPAEPEEDVFFESHANAASDILLIRVYETKIRKNGLIDYKAKVHTSYKGTTEDFINISTAWDIFGVVTGGNYLVFLYGNNFIDFCNINLYLGRTPENLMSLEYILSKPNNLKAEDQDLINRVLKYKNTP